MIGSDVYAELGVEPVVNASATLTRLGGSRMPPPVVEAMARAAEAFVDLPQVQERVGQRIAELTNNEAAYVSSGAAAGIVLAVAACIAGTDPERIAAFPCRPGEAEVIVHTSQRNGYDYAARQTGARMVEVGETADEMRAAITEQTACILWFAGAHYAEGALPLAEVIPIAREHGVPLLVDAAAQIPPVANLWHFTRDLGVDAAIFSGGKALRGPQCSGLVLGKPEIIAGCRANGNPNHSIGRPMKAGKEELVGLLAAVEWSLAQDEPAQLAEYEVSVQRWIDGLQGIDGISIERGYPSEAGQPHGRALVRFGLNSGISRDEAVAALWDGTPRVAVATIGDDTIALNPQTLEPGEDAIVLVRLREILGWPGEEGAAASSA
ncbi:MAG: aminotransferase class V-fold PLP-dependent enzyme [Chloroflexota bacterium]|nr:aminotransferase class V-fold PLP-dependent enzyme [Chloroflexota bacterium]